MVLVDSTLTAAVFETAAVFFIFRESAAKALLVNWKMFRAAGNTASEDRAMTGDPGFYALRGGEAMS